jgi:hypothetical protein
MISEKVFAEEQSSEVTVNVMRTVRISPQGRNRFVMLILLHPGKKR